MPLPDPGSSNLMIGLLAPESSPVVADRLAALSLDEPLPEAYAVDRVQLLVQSPRRLYLYWDLARDPVETQQRAFVPDADSYTTVIRLTEVESGAVTLHQAPPSRRYWFDVQPGHSYQAEIGLSAPERAFIRLLSSTVVQAPRPGVSREVAPAPEWDVGAEQFARVLNESGYVGDALEVALEGADQATGMTATHAIAGQVAGAPIPHELAGAPDLAELRRLLAALAVSKPLDDLLPSFSPALARWLEETIGGRGGDLSASGLLDIFRAMLGIETTGLTPLPPDEMAARRAPRVNVGATEVNMPAPPFHLWLPRMTSGGMKDELTEEHSSSFRLHPSSLHT